MSLQTASSLSGLWQSIGVDGGWVGGAGYGINLYTPWEGSSPKILHVASWRASSLSGVWQMVGLGLGWGRGGAEPVFFLLGKVAHQRSYISPCGEQVPCQVCGS